MADFASTRSLEEMDMDASRFLESEYGLSGKVGEKPHDPMTSMCQSGVVMNQLTTEAFRGQD